MSPKVTQLVSGIYIIHPQVCLIPKDTFFPNKIHRFQGTPNYGSWGGEEVGEQG